MHRKILCYIVVICLIISGVLVAGCNREEPEEQQASDFEEVEPEPEPIFYIALGDSVAAGFGVMEDVRYTNLLFDKLKRDEIANDYRNMAVSGYTTTALLELLERLSRSNLEAFEQASVITINIGGNNIMQPLLVALSDFQEIGVMLNEAVETTAEVREIIDDAVEFANEARDLIDNFSIADVLRINSFIRRAIEVMDELTETYSQVSELRILELVDTMQGQFSDELEQQLLEGVELFELEFYLIIDWLKTNAPNAIIIVNTVYNPIPSEIGDFAVLLSERVGTYIQNINEIILENSETRGFLVSDVYLRFKDEPNINDIMNSNLDMSAMTLNFDIIHPNNIGHAIIAELNYDLIRVR